jgi:hypothetical protein
LNFEEARNISVEKRRKGYEFNLNLNRMALLKEDTAFTHVIAIDFGTGASG